MAKFDSSDVLRGELNLSTRSTDGVIVVTFSPTSDSLQEAGIGGTPAPSATLAEIDSKAQTITIYPTITLPIPDRLLQPKHEKIRSIEVPFEEPYFDVDESMDVDEFTDLLSSLPRGLVQNPQYGLGIAKEYAIIIDRIEEFTSCTEILFSRTEPTRVDGAKFVFSLRDFEDLRVELDRIAARGQIAVARVKMAHARNFLAPAFGVDTVPINRGRHPMVQLLADKAADSQPLTDEEQDQLIAATFEASDSIARRRPDALMKLAGDIELVTLEVLIDRFRIALSARKSEAFWQSFFKQNPFVLHLAFGAPVVLVQSTASVGGRRLSGEGEKIADFLSKNVLTGNLAIFEIKRPDTKLVESRPYRLGLHAPSKELTGAISQVLDQRYRLTEALPLLKSLSREWTLEAYAVRCCVIAGQIPDDDDQKKSFELFRGNLRNVETVTYDELLAKLEQLRALLRTAADDDSGQS